MSWHVNERNSALDEGVVCAETFIHRVVADGKCTMCGHTFNVVFTKKSPDTTFEPLPTYECPCGHYIFNPENRSHQTKATPLKRRQLRALANEALEKALR